MPSFSAALLAGGASKRMGRDKALLPSGEPGLLLWQRQWRVLEDLSPDEIFWSGPPRPHLPSQARIVADMVEKSGPLAGITACLHAMQTDLLIVLAVDLPQMNAAFLRSLAAHGTQTSGAVVRHGDFFEPLAAVYPKRLYALAAEHLAQGRFALQDFIREALKLNAMSVLPLNESDVPLFKNVNAASDI